jgi:hypothetical protein
VPVDGLGDRGSTVAHQIADVLDADAVGAEDGHERAISRAPQRAVYGWAGRGTRGGAQPAARPIPLRASIGRSQPGWRVMYSKTKAVASPPRPAANALITLTFTATRVAFGPLDQLRAGSGTDAYQRDKMMSIHRPPASLRSLDELERHCQPGGLRPVALGDLGPEPYGGEGRFHGVGRAQGAPGAAIRRLGADRCAPRGGGPATGSITASPCDKSTPGKG